MRKEGSQLTPSFVDVIGACSESYEGALQSPEKYNPGVPFHCGILTFVLQMVYCDLDEVGLCIRV